MRLSGLVVLAAGLAAACQAVDAVAAPQVFFDDFSYPDLPALWSGGWRPRTQSGHPGVEGATWADDAFELVDDPDRPGNRLLRLKARSDGTGAGTRQAQLCHARKYLEGTYAARVRFRDRPSQGQGGDPIIETFYLVSPLRHDYDPDFSEIDWEYLPNGGWGSDKTRLYGISWQTVRLDPWDAHNQAHQEMRSLDGWHVLTMQVGQGHTRLYIDGRQVDRHGGRNYPVVPMSINFNLWFAPDGLLPASALARVYEQDVDWVYHVRGQLQTPEQVLRTVQGMRRQGLMRIDTVPEADPPLPSRCDF